MTEGLDALTPMSLMTPVTPPKPLSEPIQPIKPIKTTHHHEEIYRDTIASYGPTMPAEDIIADHIEESWENVVNWVWSVVSPDSPKAKRKEKTAADPVLDAANRAEDGIPYLEPPPHLTQEDIRRFILEMNDLIQCMKDSIDDTEQDFNFDQFLIRVFRDHIEEQEETTRMNAEKLVESNRERQHFNAIRRKVTERLIERQGQSRLWGMFESAVSMVGLASSAVEATTAWGAVAIMFGLGIIGEQMIGDPAKQRLAKMMAQGDEEKQTEWVERLRLIGGIAALITYLSLGGVQKLDAHTSLTRAGAIGSKGWYDFVAQLDGADSMEVGEKIHLSNEDIKKNLNENKRLVDTIAKFFRTLGEVQRNQLEASLSMIKR